MNLSVRKPLVIDYKLPYPTGTATGVMINSFFTNGDLAKQQASSCGGVLHMLWNVDEQCNIGSSPCAPSHQHTAPFVMGVGLAPL